uniref:Uncharacterized protein n=1 Tax=Anguilla anguilla TaxID=7936 RepID=A0A0E9V884_ANGAN
MLFSRLGIPEVYVTKMQS